MEPDREGNVTSRAGAVMGLFASSFSEYFNHPLTALDCLNVCKIVTGCCILALAATKNACTMRHAIYIGLHGSYLIWWLSEQWLFEPFSNRLQTEFPDPLQWAMTVFIIGVLYAWPAWNTFQNTKEIGNMTAIISILSFVLGSFINLMADVQLHAFKAALAPAKVLVTSGIFRLARNPNYFGDWLRYLGICLCSGRASSFILPAVIIVMNVSSLWDTKGGKGSMRETYGEAYTEWMIATPYAFVPVPPSSTVASEIILVTMIWAFVFLGLKAVRLGKNRILKVFKRKIT